jgi:hypothetical protein
MRRLLLVGALRLGLPVYVASVDVRRTGSGMVCRWPGQSRWYSRSKKIWENGAWARERPGGSAQKSRADGKGGSSSGAAKPKV